MSSETDQLSTDFQAVQGILELYPNIKVINIGGEPPDTYELEYQIKGYMRAIDGSIAVEAQHRVRISLPFGYPHFPPTVKPLSPIFHPDIDPDAVRIASYWQGNPSLADLLLQIGEMICGKVYNLDDPFNQEAADWYAEHLSALPLDSLQMAGVQLDDIPGDSGDDTLDMLILEDEDDDEDDDSEDGVAGLGLDLEIEFDDDAEETEEESEDVAAQLKSIQLHIDNKEVVEAGRILADLPAETSGKFGVEQAISSAMAECDKLIAQAEAEENKGNFDEALELAKKADDIVIDSPELIDLKKRLKNSQLMADTFSGTVEEPEGGGDDEIIAPKKEKGNGKDKKKDKGQDKKEKKKENKKEDKKEENKEKKPSKLQSKKSGRGAGIDIPIIPILAGLVVIVVLGGGGMVYFLDSSALKSAKADWQETHKLMGENQYDHAKKKAQTALKTLNRVRVLGSKKDALHVEISALLSSAAFKRGVKGEVEYKGEYLPVKVAQTHQLLDESVAVAEKLLNAGNTAKAIAAYSKAAQYALKNNLQVRATEIETKVNNLRFKESKALARRAEKAEDWENAAATYERALALSKTLGDDALIGEISKKVAEVNFQHDLDKSKKSFTGKQWEQTVTMLEHSKELLNANPDAVTAEQQGELDQLLAEAQLFHILSQARQAYEKGKLDTAIREYNRSLTLIQDQQNFLPESYTDSAVNIKRTILMIEITRKQNAATAAEQEKDIERALTRYRELLTLIQQSGLNRDSAILAIEKKTRDKIQSETVKITMDKRKGWLESHFEELFHKAYPSSKASTLSKPKVTFLKEQNGQQIFKITCSEWSRGSSYGLELNYRYNLASGKWSVYTGQ